MAYQTNGQSEITKKAFRTASILLGATILLDLVYLIISVQINAWQMYLLTGIIFMFGLVNGVSLIMIRRNQIALGIWLIIGGMLIIFPAASLLIEGVGLVLGISLVLLTIAVASQTLPQAHVTWALVAGTVAGVVTFLLDTPGLGYRLTVPQIQTIVPFVTAVVIIVYLFFVVRQYADYSLRVKLIVAFLVVSLLSVGAVAVGVSRGVTQSVTEEVGGNLRSLADSQALSIGGVLARQLDSLRSLALNRSIIDRLKLSNTRYGSDPARIRAQLLSIDNDWRNVENPEADFLVRTRLDNAVATELYNFQETFPEHIEMFITDKHGGILAATSYLPKYFYGDDDWWQTTFNGGDGAIYMDQPVEDKSADLVSMSIALPVYEDGEVVGVLYTLYSMASVAALVDSVAENTAAGLHADLVFPDGRILSDMHNVDVVTFETLGQIRTALLKPYEEFEFEGQLSLVSPSSVAAITGEPEIADLNWIFVAHHERESALAGIQAQLRNIIMLTLGVAGVVVLMAIFFAQFLANPIIRLTEVAQRVSSGDLTSRAHVESHDEVGTLAATFNQMTQQLNDTIDTLEERVQARTRQIETVVEIGQRLTGILELNDLMRQVVTLTKETFDYYHVHIYLLDNSQESLIMAEGYGEAGAAMKRQGHTISLAAPKSLVARAAREGEIITVENVRLDSDWLPNPLLPNTYSEMAVPVILDNEVVGVLDVQSEHVGGLTQEDESSMLALANQIAVAVRNARVFAETQQALDQAQKLQRIYTGEIWSQLASQTADYEIRQPTQPPLEQISTPEVNTALQQKQTVDLRIGSSGNDSGQNKDAATDKDAITEMVSTLATPLKLRDQVVGVLGIRDETNPNRHWTENEIALIEAVSEQMSLAIENARLFENTQRSAWRDQLISESTAQVWSSAEIEEVMRTAVAQLGDKLRASEVVIRLGTGTE